VLRTQAGLVAAPCEMSQQYHRHDEWNDPVSVLTDGLQDRVGAVDLITRQDVTVSR